MAHRNQVEEGAIDAVEEARLRVVSDPSHLGHLETLARTQWAQADYAGLLATLRRLTSLNPFEPGYHFLRGAALQCQGFFQEALAAYERCASGPPSPTSLAAMEAAGGLRRWPGEVAACLAEVDLAFRARLQRDPGCAWRELGFDLDRPEAERVHAFASDAVGESSWQRPS